MVQEFFCGSRRIGKAYFATLCRLMPNAERQTPNLERRTPNVERLPQDRRVLQQPRAPEHPAVVAFAIAVID
jgi:hypothetical protein